MPGARHPRQSPHWDWTDSGQLFRLAGDFCHLGSKIVLLLSIHRNRSAEGMPTPPTSMCHGHG